jgi:hypothetical protein
MRPGFQTSSYFNSSRRLLAFEVRRMHYAAYLRELLEVAGFFASLRMTRHPLLQPITCASAKFSLAFAAIWF